MFVDRLPWNSHEGRVIRQNLRFGFLQDGCRGLIHFGHHLTLVFPVLESDASDGNPITIHACVADGDPVVGAGRHFAVGMKRYEGRVALVASRLEAGPKAGNVLGPTGVVAGAAAPELHSEAAEVIALTANAMIESRHVDMLAADSVVVLDWGAEQFRNKAEHVQTHLLGQVTANHVRRVADAIRMA